MGELAPPSRKNTKPVVILWRGSHHAYHHSLRAAIAEIAASGGLSGHWLGPRGDPYPPPLNKKAEPQPRVFEIQAIVHKIHHLHGVHVL